MNKFIIYVFLLLAGLKTPPVGTDYYVDSVSGSDGAAGTSTGTAWQTLTKVNSTSFSTGDRVFLKRGGTFYGQIRPNIAGLTYDAYGSGVKPIVTGLTSLSSWTNLGSNIYESPCPSCGTQVNTLVDASGVSQPMGRFPNPNTANGGYLIFTSSSTLNSNNNQITGSLSGSPSYVGKTLVVRQNNYTVTQGYVTNQSGGTLTWLTNSTLSINNNFGYYFQNSLSFLDQPGEWYYDSTAKKIKFYSTSTPGTLQVSSVDTLATALYNNIRFNNINFYGANRLGIYMNGGTTDSVTNCNVAYSGGDGIMMGSVTSPFIDSDTIWHIGNNGIYSSFGNPTSPTITNNYVYDIGATAGQITDFANAGIMGNGIVLQGTGQNVSGNTVRKTGYNGIISGGTGGLVQKNVVDSFNTTLDDGGGLYTGGAVSEKVFRKNVISNGIGAPFGTDDTLIEASTHGIYADDNTSHLIIDSNSVSFSRGGGVRLHNGRDTRVTYNLLYGNVNQIDVSHDNGGFGTPTHDTIKNNILVKTSPYQLGFHWYEQSSTPPSNTIIDSNYYLAPQDSLGFWKYEYSGIREAFDMALWRTKTGYDTRSKISPHNIQLYGSLTTTGSSFISGTSSGTSAASYLLLNFSDLLVGHKYLLKFKSSSSVNEPANMEGQFLDGGTYTTIDRFLSFVNCTTTPVWKYIPYTPTHTAGHFQVNITHAVGTILLDSLDLHEVTSNFTNIYDSVYYGTNPPSSTSPFGNHMDASGASVVGPQPITPYYSKFFFNIFTTPTVVVRANGLAAKTLTLPCYTAPDNGEDAVTLNGRLSSGGTGIPMTWAWTWTKTSGPNTPVFENIHAPDTRVKKLVQGTYVFTGTAVDLTGGSASASVTVTVNAASAPPTMTTDTIGTPNAGNQITITGENNKIHYIRGGTYANLYVYNSHNIILRPVPGPTRVSFFVDSQIGDCCAAGPCSNIRLDGNGVTGLTGKRANKGFFFKTTGASGRAALYLVDSTRNIYLTNFEVEGNPSNLNGQGLALDIYNQNILDTSTANQTHIRQNGYTGGNDTVTNFYIHGVYNEGLYVGASHTGWKPGRSYQPYFNEPVIDTLYVNNGYIDTCGQSGMNLGAVTGLATIQNTTFAHYALNQQAGHEAGVNFNPSTKAIITNCTFWNQLAYTSQVEGINYQGMGSQDLIYNNVFIGLQRIIVFGRSTDYNSGFTDGSVYFYNNTGANAKYMFDLFSNNFSNPGVVHYKNNISVGWGISALANGNDYTGLDSSNNKVNNVSLASMKFVDTTALNFRLTSTSPAISAGLNFSSLYTVDADGTVRTLPFDIGAFEYTGPGSPTYTNDVLLKRT